MKFNKIRTFCETYQQVPKDVCLVKLKIYIKTKLCSFDDEYFCENITSK